MVYLRLKDNLAITLISIQLLVSNFY